MKKEAQTIDLSALSRNELETEYVKLNDKALALEAELSWLKEQVKLSKSQRYGSSSEKGLGDGTQMSIFNEAELAQDPQEPEPTDKDLRRQKEQGKKKTGKRGSKKDKIRSLPVDRVEYKLPEEEQICPKCGSPLHEMKKIIHDEIEVIPAQYKVKRDVEYVYSCRECEKNGTEASIVNAPSPNHFFLNSLASPSLVADIICRKYVLALPLYRQEQEFRRYGLALSRQTISNWVIRASDQYLYRIYEGMKKKLLAGDIIHADETEVQVLQEPGRDAQAKSYMWVYTSGKYDTPCFLYEYAPGRGSEYPMSMLKRFSGYLQTDGYAAYGKVADDPERDADHQVTQVACLAHARRKFTDALKASSVKDPPNIKKGITYCDRLFEIERNGEQMPPDERKEYRTKHAVSVLDEYFAWLKEIEGSVLPKSKLGTAVSYSLKLETPLRRYLEDGRLEISNNRAERAVKPFVIGRKNWLFSNTPDGAESSAMIYSIAETAKACGLKPFEYFTHVLTALSQTPEIDIQTLLPWSDTLPAACRLEETATTESSATTADNKESN